MRKTTPQRAGEPLTKRCSSCHEKRWIVEFRVLSHGSRTSLCEECERVYDRLRKSRHLYPDFVGLSEARNVPG